MKIALISQPFDAIVPPSMNSIGIWTNEISRRLAKDNEVIVYARRGIAPKREIGENVTTRYILSLPNSFLTNLSMRVSRYRNPKKPLFSTTPFHLEYILPIALDLRRRGVEIAHLQNYSQFVPVIRAFNPNIKIVLHMRCEWLALLDYDMIDRRLEKTDLILGVSNAITEEIRQRFPHHAKKCHTAYTGVDTDVFKPAEPSARRMDGRRELLFVGRITPEKGIHILLEAFRKIAGEFPDLHLNLIGSVGLLARDRLVGMSDEKKISDLDVYYNGTEYLTSLNAIIAPDLLDRVHFVGHIRYAKTIEYYQNSSILINPSITEPFGRSLIEANACGAPIIAARAGGMVELVQQGKNGLLVEPGNVDELAEAIRFMLRNESQRASMGNEGRKFVVDNFSWDSIKSRLFELYQDTFSTGSHKEDHLAVHPIH